MTLETVAPRPPRDQGRVLVTRGYDHLRGGVLAERGMQLPPAIGSLDPIYARSKTDIESVPLGVVLEVSHGFVARRKKRRALGIAGVGQRRGPATRVQPQPVIAPAPGRSDRVRTLQHDRSHSRMGE